MKEPDLLPNEEWRPVKRYEGLYEVSNFGRVRRVRERETRTRYKYLKPSVNLSKKCKQEGIGVHILVAGAFRNAELDKAYTPRIEVKPDFDEPSINEPSIDEPSVNAWAAVLGEDNYKPKSEPEPDEELNHEPEPLEDTKL